MRKMIFAAVSLLLMANLWTVSHAAEQTPPPDATSIPQEGLRIFVCGHSFHMFIWFPLWELAHEAGLKDHGRWGPQFIGGSSTLQHWNLPDDKNLAKQHLTQGDVDVLTMSPKSFPDEGVEKFVKLGLEHNPNMRFTVQLSWGGYDGDNQLSNKPPATIDWNKTPAQILALYEPNIKAGEDQIAKLNKQIGRQVVFLVPTAQAVLALRTKIYNKELPGLDAQSQLFQDAIGHPTAPIQALNAYLHYAVIYHRNPTGLPRGSALKGAHNDAWDEKFNRSLEELAWEIVTNYPPSGVTAAPEVKQRTETK